MKKRLTGILLLTVLFLAVGGCGREADDGEVINSASGGENLAAEQQDMDSGKKDKNATGKSVPQNGDTVTEGTEEYRGFLLDNILHSENDGDIHYNLYVPDSYDGSTPYALFFTLPGYEGLYFQGVGENLYSENFEFEAQN